MDDLLRTASELLRSDANRRPVVDAKKRSCDFPLSLGQRQMWFLWQLNPTSSAYHSPVVYRLKGALDEGALNRAILEIQKRHEVLRSTFQMREGGLVQNVRTLNDWQLQTLDLRHLGRDELEPAVKTAIAAEVRRAFDLESGPPLRALLVRLDERESVLAIVMHHMVTDGWSVRLILEELDALYSAYAVGKEPLLEESPLQYTDYSLWQEDWLNSNEFRRGLEYWQRQLAGSPLAVELPSDKERPQVQTFCGASERLIIPKRTAYRLREISRHENVTLFILLLGGIGILLRHLSQQDDFVVGVPFANRNLLEAQKLIGFFANTLPLRIDLSGDPTIRDVLSRVRDVILGAADHQQVPFESIVGALSVERDLSRNPLFQVVVAPQNGQEAKARLGDLEMLPEPVETESVKFDLTFSVLEADPIEFQLEYNTDLFERVTAVRILEQLQKVLEQVAAGPERHLSELGILTEAERRQALEQWNRTEREYPRNRCVSELFEEQVRQRPEAVALRFGNEELSYAELNRQANRLAHYLRSLGVDAETRVAVMGKRSAAVIVGLLAVLKAGGAYVPLEASDPPERTAFMLADTDAAVLLTQREYVSKVPSYQRPIFCLDSDWESIKAESDQNPAPIHSAQNLAYVIYTSGSTGEPKGVAVCHRSIARLVCNTNYVDLTPEDRVAQIASMAFDAATFEIWGALLNGAQLIGIGKDVLLSPPELGRALRRSAITTAFFTASHFDELAREAPDMFAGMRWLLFGGGVANLNGLLAVQRKSAPEHFVNGYGPTETTTFATTYEITSSLAGTRRLPIGCPINNTTAYILDRDGQPVPPGVVGELYLSGDGLARCYLNRPELTAERFVPNPFGRDGGERLYRTGDLTRYRSDGVIEYLGRTDYQVKIRGFRVELGEIEAVVNRHPEVGASTIVLREDTPENKRIVGYWVKKSGSALDDQELRRYLRRHLPEYMVPDTLVTLPGLPLSTNGKIDWRRLPDPALSGECECRLPDRPCNDIEQALYEVWVELLQTTAVGLHDNFFDLGGDSLKLMRLMWSVQNLFPVQLTIQTLFDACTISQLADVIAERLTALEDDAAIDEIIGELENLSETEAIRGLCK